MCSQSRAARRVYSIRSPQVRQVLTETFAFRATSSIRKISLDILHPSGKKPNVFGNAAMPFSLTSGKLVSQLFDSPRANLVTRILPFFPAPKFCPPTISGSPHVRVKHLPTLKNRFSTPAKIRRIEYHKEFSNQCGGT